MKVLVAAAVVGLLAQQARPGVPQAPQGTARLSGVLTNVDTSEPVRKAQVKLVVAESRTARVTTSDGEGRFVFENLPGGTYTLSASKPGFLETVFGAKRPGPSVPGTPIQLGPEQKIDKVALRMWRGGVISGVVLDEFGDPSFNTLVRALRFVYLEGERTLTPAGQATTDDLGGYRLAGLLPGDYIVSAIPRETVQFLASQAETLRDRLAAAGRSVPASAPASIDPTGYAPVYHPGTAAPGSAINVRVGLSGLVAGVDIRLQLLRTATVKGMVLSPEGAPVGGANLQLIDPSMPVANIGVWFRTARSDGSFSFSGVAPGSYVLRGQGGPAGAHVTAASTVMADPMSTSPVELRLERGSTVSGRLALDTLTVPVTLSRMRVELRPILSPADWERGPVQATPDATGRFVLRDVEPGRYRILVSGLPQGWTLKSAVFGSHDAADGHVIVEPNATHAGGVLRFTDKSAEILGTLTEVSGRPAGGYVVIVFPEDRALWLPQSRRIQVALSSADGKYTLGGLPSGEYRIIALQEPESGREFDPEFLGSLITAATTVTLADGEKRTQDFRVR